MTFTSESIDDFFTEATGEAKPSADTVINEETGERVEPAVAAAATPEAPPMSESEATKQAQVLMDMRESAQAIGLAYMADGEIADWARYKYGPGEKRLLVEAWAPIVQGMQLRVNKWVHVLYAEGIATTPLIVTAMKARSLRIENEQLKEQLRAMHAQQAAGMVPTPAQEQTARVLNLTPTPPAAWNRLNYDSKTKWKVDDFGFFEHGKDGYINQGERREKPMMTPEVYEMLCKHNGKERIDQLYDL